MTGSDPRPFYFSATEWVSSLLEGVSRSRLTAPTPCPDFDVMCLSGHLRGGALRVSALAEGADVLSVSMTDRIHDVQAYNACIESARALWADDMLLESPLTVPWGVVPGADALWGFVNETLVHGWDLAVATDQKPESPAWIAEATLPFAHSFIVDGLRGPGAPFGAAVPSRPAAGPTEMLANWNGRRSSHWVEPIGR